MLAFGDEFKVILLERALATLVLDVLVHFFIKDKLSCHVENFLGISKSVVKSLSSVDHQQSPVLGRFLVFLENLVIINVSHLPCQFSDSKLAVSKQVFEGRLVFPVFVLLFQEGLKILDFVLSQHFDVSFGIKLLHKADIVSLHFVYILCVSQMD